jgi:glutamine synthetase adenylyltransferase
MESRWNPERPRSDTVPRKGRETLKRNTKALAGLALVLAGLPWASQELTRIEELLEGMAENASGRRLHELQSLAETLADARLAVESEPEEAGPALEALARALNQVALKRDLILRS